MGWNEDREWAEAAMPFQDEVYKNVFKDCLKNITRFSKEDRHILDIHYHIDIELELENGIKLLGQEKALRKKYSHFNTFTIEFYQNRYIKEKGEFFNLGAQFYFHGYLDGNHAEEITGFIKYYFIKIFDFLEYLKKTPIERLEKFTKPSDVMGTGQANFFYVRYDKIPNEFIYIKKEQVQKNNKQLKLELENNWVKEFNQSIKNGRT